MSRQWATLPSSLGPVFTRGQALAAGVSPGRLRAPDLRLLGRGLYARAGIGATAAQIVAALCRDDPSVFAVGPTAAELLEMPLPLALTTQKDPLIRMSSQAKRSNSPILEWHRYQDTAPDDVVSVRGMRVTSRIRTLCDLSAVLEVDDLVACADHLIREPRPQWEGRSKPYASLEQLVDAAQAHQGRRGAKSLRAALARARVGSDSPAETALRLAFEDAGLPAPLLNVEVIDDGEWLGTPDMSWPELRVCLEHEGRHHLTKEQQDRDIDRTERRVLRGWYEVRTVAKDLRNGCARAIARARAALRLHGWEG
jgi:hypothetical protein